MLRFISLEPAIERPHYLTQTHALLTAA